MLVLALGLGLALAASTSVSVSAPLPLRGNVLSAARFSSSVVNRYAEGTTVLVVKVRRHDKEARIMTRTM